jgi:hypothetical protein
VTSDQEQPPKTAATPPTGGPAGGQQPPPVTPLETPDPGTGEPTSPPDQAAEAPLAAAEVEKGNDAAQDDAAQDEAAEDTEDVEAEPPDSRRSMLVGLGVLAVVLVGVLIAVVATGGGGGESTGAASSSTTRPVAAGPTLPPGALKAFHDDLTGFTIQYPMVWPLAQAPVSEVRFAVTAPQGAAVSIRVNEIEQATTPDNLGNLKSVSDGIIGGNPSAKVLKTDAITLNGIIGYYYLYTFTDAPSGLQGVHAHYFLFKDHKMYSIVFQVLPADLFASAAGIFDQMAQSFKVDPAPPPTTAP